MSYITKREGNQWVIKDVQSGLTVMLSQSKKLVRQTARRLNSGGGFDTHVPMTLFSTPVRF